jgi:tRNA dimethylallyltransferase
MMNEGLLSEVDSLYKRGLLPSGSTAAQAIGYKEIISAIEGECTVKEAIEQIKLSTRRYAKRQLTWFRHEKEAKRIFVDGSEGMRDFGEVLAKALCLCKKFLEN